MEWGGSHVRKEATGYGLIYFVQEVLKASDDDIKGKTVAITGAGAVSLYALEKCLHLGAKVIAISDSKGTITSEEGFTKEQLRQLIEIKQEKKGSVGDLVDGGDKKEDKDEKKEGKGEKKEEKKEDKGEKKEEKKEDKDEKKEDKDEKKGDNKDQGKGLKVHKDKKPWEVLEQVDIVLPCATENEIDNNDAERIIKLKAKIVAEGANMPCYPDAIEAFQKNGVVYVSGIASNAGGVAVSEYEMAQNSQRERWEYEHVEERLRKVMHSVHEKCVKYGKDKDGKVNYAKGAYIAGFVRVADAMIDQGIVWYF